MLLAVLCGESSQSKRQGDFSDQGPRFPFPEIVSSGRLEAQVLNNPSIEEFRKVVNAFQPNLVYLQGEQLQNGEIGSLVWGDVDLSTDEAISSLFASTTAMPTTVYLEVPNGEELAKALHSRGTPYVIYWKNAFSRYGACQFRHALFSVVQSSSSHTWDVFHLARASFKLYCVRNNIVLPDDNKMLQSDNVDDNEVGPQIIGAEPSIDVAPHAVDEEEGGGEADEEGAPRPLPAINIYDDDVTMRFLVCGLRCPLDTCLLGALEDGLNALLSIEMRGCKLHNRVSALPPPLQAGTFSRGVVTMRCDLSTSTSAHISLLVSGSAQTCFDDQLLENHIKSQVIEKSRLVHALAYSEENKPPLSEPRRSASIACGAAVFEVSMKVPNWASQILRQLAPDVSYRNLVALGIASVHGLAVASFEEDDAERLLFLCSKNKTKNNTLYDSSFDNISPPSWLKSPAPCRKRSEMFTENGGGFTNPLRKKLKVTAAALRPIPHIRHQKMLPFSVITESNGGHEGSIFGSGGPIKAANFSLHVSSTKHSNHGGNASGGGAHRKSLSSSYQSKQIISLNPLPLKKHGCDRSPIHVCSEEEFLKDVMQFLILRGHNRLIPQGGIAEFPDAILNAKRLDLFNLYREVVSRGGFHVGNGINWKGQVFSKMRNHTVTNRMTGVGNTLKRHYETYLLEYELAHDDVDGECCLLCHSSAAGDWVNCGICGEWAHFGCDRRQGLGAFKDYAKTDGLEYICPQCSVSNFKKKPQKNLNGFS